MWCLVRGVWCVVHLICVCYGAFFHDVPVIRPWSLLPPPPPPPFLSHLTLIPTPPCSFSTHPWAIIMIVGIDRRHVLPQLLPEMSVSRNKDGGMNLWIDGFVRKLIGLGLTARLLPMTSLGFNRSACVGSPSPRLIGSGAGFSLRDAL